VSASNARDSVQLRIPGTCPNKGVPHYTNYKRLTAFETATGIKAVGDHSKLMDWLLPALCLAKCRHCDELGVRMRGPVWVICDNCGGSVWLVTPGLRRKLREIVRVRYPRAVI
jgi:hypothetical protein